MMKKIALVMIIIMFLFSSSVASAALTKVRVRITNVNIEERSDFLQTEKDFNVSVEIENNRKIFRLIGQLQVYLTYAGLPQIEIGRTDFSLKCNGKDTVDVLCKIKDSDINSFVVNYKITVILFEERLKFLVKRDTSSLESFSIVSKFWEKDKLEITEFKPLETWPAEETTGEYESQSENGKYERGISSKANNKTSINVSIINNGKLDFNGIVRIDLIEKPSSIPFIEGINEIRKEIGRELFDISANEKLINVNVTCTLREADQYKDKFNVQAVLLVDVDGKLYEVDKSSIQTIKVEDSILEKFIFYGFWIWVLIVIILVTVLLFASITRVFWPYTKIKKKELKYKLENIEKGKGKKK